jgi:hypothetical protein
VYLSAMLAMVRKARMRDRSGLEPRFCHLPREEERKSPWGPDVHGMDRLPELPRRRCVAPCREAA